MNNAEPTPAPTPDKLAEQFVQAVKRAAKRFRLGHFVVEYRILGNPDSHLAAVTFGDVGEAAVAQETLNSLRQFLADNQSELAELADEARQQAEEDHDDADESDD